MQVGSSRPALICYIFGNRESGPKASFATGILGGECIQVIHLLGANKYMGDYVGRFWRGEEIFWEWWCCRSIKKSWTIIKSDEWSNFGPLGFYLSAHLCLGCWSNEKFLFFLKSYRRIWCVCVCVCEPSFIGWQLGILEGVHDFHVNLFLDPPEKVAGLMVRGLAISWERIAFGRWTLLDSRRLPGEVVSYSLMDLVIGSDFLSKASLLRGSNGGFEMTGVKEKCLFWRLCNCQRYKAIWSPHPTHHRNITYQIPCHATTT